jgi:hypothetical protein
MPVDRIRDELLVQLAQLERERDEVAASLPAHSTPSALLMRLEDLDEVIAALRARLDSLPEDESGA